MIKLELGIIVNNKFIKQDINPTHCRHYSDSGKVIVKVSTSEEYDDAIDIMPCIYTYVESDKEIEQENTFTETDGEVKEINYSKETFEEAME